MITTLTASWQFYRTWLGSLLSPSLMLIGPAVTFVLAAGIGLLRRRARLRR